MNEIEAERARVKRLLAPVYLSPKPQPKQPPIQRPPEPPPEPLRPGEGVTADKEGIARLIALDRAGLLDSSPVKRTVKPISRTTKPSEPVLRNFD